MINCKFCNKIFIPRRKTNIFCSTSCSNRWMWKVGKLKPKTKKGIIKICKFCGKKYYIAQHRKETAKYCSRNCLAKIELSKYVAIYGFKKSGKPYHRYKIIKTPDGKYMRIHRWIMENYLGRKLNSDEHIHHIDGNTNNNNIDNLIVLSNSEHQKLELMEKNNARYT